MNDTELVSQLWTCVLLVLSASSLLIAITQTATFSSIRVWVMTKNTMIGRLFHRFNCLNHSTVLISVVIYLSLFISSTPSVTNLTVSVLFTIAIAIYFTAIVFKIFINALSKAKTEKVVMG